MEECMAQFLSVIQTAFNLRFVLGHVSLSCPHFLGTCRQAIYYLHALEYDLQNWDKHSYFSFETLRILKDIMCFWGISHNGNEFLI